MMKIGDKVRLKPGVVGEGQTGVIEKIEPWNLDSPYPDVREGFYSNWPNAVRDGAGRL